MTKLRIDPKPVAYVLHWFVMVLSLLNTSLLGPHSIFSAAPALSAAVAASS
jgi:hypothetical protein